MPSRQEREGYRAEIAVTYVHPPKGCPNDGTRETRYFSTEGRNKEQAERRARVLAENDPPLCSLCGNWYRSKEI